MARQIPEFPSIALPVAAILGMIAIIGRRKE
ncbi:PEF-CTERM sorting domain-containing protein [Methanosarcina mazei]|nr:PEF-CTERM sorting domain-containing protein [Methanosarcina mazei]